MRLLIIQLILFFICLNVKAEYEKTSILCEGMETLCTLEKLEYNIDPQAKCDSMAKEGQTLVAFPNPKICNCGLMCIEYLEEGSECKKSYMWEYPEAICGPMLSCQPKEPGSSEYTCQKDDSKKCVEEVIQYDDDLSEGILGPARARPNCKEDGKYNGKQCSPGTTCYCVNEEGERIFGEAPESKSENMTCGCSANWNDETLKETKIGMKCLPDGSFDALQCFEDVCFCFDPMTLELTQGPYHKTMVDQMKCYDDKYHSKDLLNPCEREFQRNQNLVIGDRQVIDNTAPSCTPDGYYAAVQQRGTFIHCVDYKGETIENFITPELQARDINCNCARRRAMLKEIGEMNRLPVCLPNGNFNPKQTSGLLQYCVDINGNQKDTSVPVTKPLTC